MKRAMSFGAAAVVVASALLLQNPSPGQQPPVLKPADPQPAGDAVAPTAGERKSAADAPGRTQPAPKAAASGTVRTLRLPELEPDLPDRPGRETVIVLCGVCHTTRYITIQPPLSRETWVAEITKMQKTFGAPIPEDKTPEILNYLLAVRGPQK